MKAFVLGAGLGTRLQPLTDHLPKPLVPVFHRPLVCWTFDHLASMGADSFVVNTHHLPEKWSEAFPENAYDGRPIEFRNEPVLLETAGGLANVADLLGDEPFVVYNGDLLCDLPLEAAWTEHLDSGREVTLVLRSEGPALRVLRDAESGAVTAIGPEVEDDDGGLQFTGIYFVSPAFLQRLEPGKKESVRPIFQQMIADGDPPGSVVIDEGFWADLGDREQYLDAHFRLPGTDFPLYADGVLPAARHEEAEIDGTASIDGLSVVGEGSIVCEGVVMTECVVWPNSYVGPGSFLDRCVVTGRDGAVRGLANNEDL